MNVITLAQTESTNTALSEMADSAVNGTIIRAIDQTAGRGQRGNSWESQRGKNLTFSVFLVPENISAREQFLISQAVSVAIVNVLRRYITNLDDTVAIKWPNDIYVGDQKICGILIENSLRGTAISHSIVGIGINVNQLEFRSDAPNPVSLIHFTGHETDIEKLMEETWHEIDQNMRQLSTEENKKRLREEYMADLWRREGFHPYATPDGYRFDAEVADIAPDGILTLCDPFGNKTKYAFKEVQFIL